MPVYTLKCECSLTHGDTWTGLLMGECGGTGEVAAGDAETAGDGAVNPAFGGAETATFVPSGGLRGCKYQFSIDQHKKEISGSIRATRSRNSSIRIGRCLQFWNCKCIESVLGKSEWRILATEPLPLNRVLLPPESSWIFTIHSSFFFFRNSLEQRELESREVENPQ